MSPGLTRGIGVAATIVTVGALAFSLSKGRRPLPVRPALDGLRFALSVGALVAAAAITGVSTPPALAAGGVLVGGVLGILQARALKVRALEGRVLAQRTTLGVLLWGLAMVGVQGAGIASRSGLITVGQTVAWFSAGLSAGLLTARRPMIARARRALTGAAAAAVLVLGVGSFLAPAASATDVVMSDAEVCDLIPAYTNGYGEGFYSPAASGGGDLVASCEYTVSFSPDDLLNAYLELWETSGVAQGVYDRQVEVSRGDMGTPSSLDFADEAVHFETGDGHRWTVGRVGPFVILVRGSTTAVDTVAVARELAGVTGGIAGTAAPTTTAAPATTAAPTTTAAPATTAVPTTAAPAGSEDAGLGAGTALSPTSPRLAGDDGLIGDGKVTPEEAAAAAIAVMVAALLMGLIDLWEFNAWLSGGLVPPGLFDGPGGGGPGPPPAPPGAAPGRGTSVPPPVPPVRRTTVVLTGRDAEAAIARGPGATVPIPPDQQWGVNVSVEGQPPFTADRLGSTGTVRSVGSVVRGPGGEVAVSVEVDAYDPAPPPPSPPPAGPPPAPPGPVAAPPPDVIPPERIEDAVMDGLEGLPLGGDQGAPTAPGTSAPPGGAPGPAGPPQPSAPSPSSPPAQPPPAPPPPTTAPPAPSLDPRSRADLWREAQEQLDAPGNPNPTVDSSEFVEYVRRIEEQFPGATWKQVVAALHADEYGADLGATMPGFDGSITGHPWPRFETGPDTDGYEQIAQRLHATPGRNAQTGGAVTNTAPKFVIGPDGRRIDIDHAYAGLRSDLNRDPGAWADFMRWTQTHGGDSWQEVMHAPESSWQHGELRWASEYAPPEQRIGNDVGGWLSEFYRRPGNEHVPLSEAFERYFDSH